MKRKKGVRTLSGHPCKNRLLTYTIANLDSV